MKIFKGIGVFSAIIAILVVLQTAFSAIYILDGNRIESTDLRQGVSEITSVANYPVGARLQIGEKVFRYAKIDCTSGIADTSDYGLAVATNVSQTRITDATLITAAGSYDDSNSTTIKVRVSGATLNQFRNGYLTFTDSSQSFRIWETVILASDSATSTNDTIELTIADPFPANAAKGDTITLLPNIYSAVYTPSGTIPLESIIGMFTHYNPFGTDYNNYYCWLQTWGPFSPRFVDAEGGNSGQRNIYYTGAGQVRSPDSTIYGTFKDSTGSTIKGTWSDSLAGGTYQQVGYYLLRTSHGTDYARPQMMFLTISP